MTNSIVKQTSMAAMPSVERAPSSARPSSSTAPVPLIKSKAGEGESGQIRPVPAETNKSLSLSQRLKVVNRLFEMMSSHSEIDHPLCQQCTDMLPCMHGDICSKKFPKKFTSVTVDRNDGYPEYMRRDNGRTVRLRRRSGYFTFDNSWVVPYNPWLCLKYNAHINVEICNSVCTVIFVQKIFQRSLHQ